MQIIPFVFTYRFFPSYFIIIFFLSFICKSCITRNDENNLAPKKGLKPIYLDKEAAQNIEVLTPQDLKNPGKIYVYGQVLFINELHSGVHVVDNADPQNPIPLKFIKIVGNIDIAVKDQVLYADNITDLVALDISNINQIKLLKRIVDVFPRNEFPNETGVYFECVDPTKGYVVGWEETIINNVTCLR